MRNGQTAFSTHHSQCEPQAIRDALVEVDCEDCGLDPICMVLDYAEEASGVPEGVLVRRHPVERGNNFSSGRSFPFHFAVKSGSFKTSVEYAGRSRQIIGFQFLGADRRRSNVPENLSLYR